MGASRSPHGERGLKCVFGVLIFAARRRSPHGERGLKCVSGNRVQEWRACRSPHGERGLKLSGHLKLRVVTVVALLMESVD